MKLVLIEAIPLLLQAICQTIESKSDNKVSYQASTMSNLEEILLVNNPDLLWLDTAIQAVRDGSVLKSLKKKHPDLKILFFGVDETVPEIRKYFKQGVCGYLPKTANAEEIEFALHRLESGHCYVPVSLQSTFSTWLTDSDGHKKVKCKITEREKEVLQLIIEEFTTLEIAQKLYISNYTVESHRNNLIQKLGVKNVAGLVREAMQRQLYQA